MKTPYDRFAKTLLVSVLEALGQTRTEQEVASEPQRIDVWFTPGQDQGSVEQLGLLGRMVAEACMMEPFHQPPSVQDVRESGRKQLAWEAHLARTQGREPGPLRLWLVSAGRPEKAIETLGFSALDGWLEGFLSLPKGWNVLLVVVNSLPRNRETLILRLLGSGKVLREAIRDLRTLPPDAFERQAAEPALTLTRLSLVSGAEARSEDEEEFLMETRELAEQYLKRILEEKRREGLERGLEEGREKGLEEGREKGLEEGREKGLEEGREEGERRALVRSLVAMYRARFGAMSARMAGALEGTADAVLLEAWVPLFATGSAEEIERVVETVARKH